MGGTYCVDEIVDHLVAHVLHDFGQVLGLHDLAPLRKDHLALVVHHVVELQQLLADVEVAPFDLGLRAFERLVDPRVDDRLAFLHAEGREHLVEPLRPEDAHQVVLEGQEEGRPPGIALTARTAAQLIVDAAALVPFGGENEQAAGFDHRFFVGGMAVLDPLADLVGMGVGVRRRWPPAP